jgi:uncharacterized protein DUF6049
VFHRCVRAGAVALMVVAVAAVPAPAARSRYSPNAQIAGATGLLRIASISPWVDDTHAFAVTAQVLNQTELTLDGVSVAVAVYGRVATRSQLRQALDGGTPTEALGSFSQSIPGSIGPGQQRTVTLEQPATALIGSIARTGVYPIQVTLRDSHGEETASTAMPYFASQATNPLNVTWIVPVSAPTVRPIDGAYTQAAIDSLGIAELTQQQQAIAARPGANLTLAPDPSLIDTLSDLADGFELTTPTGKQRVTPDDLIARAAADLLDEFRRSAQAAGEIATVPYVPVDLPSLAQHNMRGDALRQITLGRSVTEQILRRAPSLSILVPPNLAFDTASASALAPLGISGLVLDPGSLPQKPIEPFQPGLFGPSRPVALGDGSLKALLPDAFLTARLAGHEQGVLVAQSLIAETASSYLEMPSFGSERVLVIDSPVRMAPTSLAAAIDGLSNAPWIRMRSATEALTILPPEGAVLPLPVFARADQSFLAGARAARLALSTLESILVQPLPERDEYDRNLLAAESSEWQVNPSVGLQLARRVRSTVSGILSGIQVGSGRRVTLTSKSGSVPVTVINRNPFPVRLRVRVESAKVGFPKGASAIKQVDPPNTTVDFTVLARAAGSFPLDVRLETPDGVRLIGRGSVILRSSAVSAVALLVVAGSTFFLLLAWARRSHKRTKAAAGASTAASPADTA